jgi:outer membrane protein TolC
MTLARRIAPVSRVTRLPLVFSILAVVIAAGYASAQPPQPAERVTFTEAVSRAIERNPNSAIAAAGILRAEALLTQAQSASRLQVNALVTTTTLNRSVKFEDSTVTPMNQVAGTLDVRLPLYAPVQWARRAQAEDAKNVAELSSDNVRRQTALATADAYLTILAMRRVAEGNIRARDTAREHYELARQLEAQGAGSRLNLLRAQQELSVDEVLVEGALLAAYRAQEGLGVLLVSDGPVDAAEDPAFAPPPEGADVTPPPPGLLLQRSDLKLFSAEQSAAQRVLDDSRKDRYPYLEGILQGQSVYPSQFFSDANSARLLFQLSIPLFDSGQRAGLKAERQAALNVTTATLAGATTQASSEVRAARVAVDSATRAVTSARAGAGQAQQVVDITNISFRAGGSTNIEVIDAVRRGRDSDTAVAVAEDTLRRAQLDLLAALGLFP